MHFTVLELGYALTESTKVIHIWFKFQI